MHTISPLKLPLRISALIILTTAAITLAQGPELPAHAAVLVLTGDARVDKLLSR